MKKNILYISFHYPPSNSVAANRSFSQVTALRDLGHRVKVIFASNDNSRYIINKSHTSHDDDILIDVGHSSITTPYNKASFIKYLLIKYIPFFIRFTQQLKLFFFLRPKRLGHR